MTFKGPFQPKPFYDAMILYVLHPQLVVHCPCFFALQQDRKVK